MQPVVGEDKGRGPPKLTRNAPCCGGRRGWGQHSRQREFCSPGCSQRRPSKMQPHLAVVPKAVRLPIPRGTQDPDDALPPSPPPLGLTRSRSPDTQAFFPVHRSAMLPHRRASAHSLPSAWSVTHIHVHTCTHTQTHPHLADSPSPFKSQLKRHFLGSLPDCSGPFPQPHQAPTLCRFLSERIS